MMPSSAYWRNVALKAVVGLPWEDVAYAVFTEFLVKHKNPYERFIIYPQLSLKWSPGRHDRCAEIPDVGVGNLTVPGHNPPFKLCFGVEAKRAIVAMGGMPPPASLIDHPDVVYAFHQLSLQAKNQAKAAIKNNYPIANNSTIIQWILLIGPYWIPVTFGSVFSHYFHC